MKKRFHEWLLSPWVILSSIAIGIVIGLFNKNLAASLAPFGDLYLKLLQMCVLPLIITAIVTSLGNMLQVGTARIYFKKLIFIFLIGLFSVTSIAIVSTLIFSPGSHLSPRAKAILSEQIEKNEQTTLPNQPPLTPQLEIIKFIEKIVPSNIFTSLSKGENLAILFFSVLLGVAVGSISKERARISLHMFDAIYLAFLKIIAWIMYGLPFGLCFLFAGYIAEMGLGILFALGKLILLLIFLGIFTILAYGFLIWYKTGYSALVLLKAFKTPLLIAFSTSNSFATLPTLLASLQHNLKLDKTITDLVVPLGTSLNQPGGALHFAATSIFIAQLYGHSLTLDQLLFTLFTAIFASIATSGIPVIAAVSVFAMVLEPLSLPASTGIIFLAAIEPIVDPFMTVVGVSANSAAAVLIAYQKETPTLTAEPLTNEVLKPLA